MGSRHASFRVCDKQEQQNAHMYVETVVIQGTSISQKKNNLERSTSYKGSPRFTIHNSQRATSHSPYYHALHSPPPVNLLLQHHQAGRHDQHLVDQRHAAAVLAAQRHLQAAPVAGRRRPRARRPVAVVAHQLRHPDAPHAGPDGHELLQHQQAVRGPAAALAAVGVAPLEAAPAARREADGARQQAAAHLELVSVAAVVVVAADAHRRAASGPEAVRRPRHHRRRRALVPAAHQPARAVAPRRPDAGVRDVARGRVAYGDRELRRRQRQAHEVLAVGLDLERRRRREGLAGHERWRRRAAERQRRGRVFGRRGGCCCCCRGRRRRQGSAVKRSQQDVPISAAVAQFGSRRPPAQCHRLYGRHVECPRPVGRSTHDVS